MKLKQLPWFVLLAASAMLPGGCVTSKVWEEGQFARYHEPASPPGLRLFHSSQRQDLLVEYVEARESDGATQRRASWLYRDPSGRVKQVLLTPPAVIVDATIVGGVLAVAVAPSLWTSLNCLVH